MNTTKNYIMDQKEQIEKKLLMINGNSKYSKNVKIKQSQQI